MRGFWSRLCSDSWKLEIVGKSHIKPHHIRGYTRHCAEQLKQQSHMHASQVSEAVTAK